VRAHLRRWGAVWLLIALFLASWAGQFVAQLAEVASEAEQHGQTFTWAEFWPWFLSSTFENWQSEWLQLAVQAGVVVGAAHLLFKRGEDQTDRIEAKLDRLLGERQ
jgi:hypothetical protein